MSHPTNFDTTAPNAAPTPEAPAGSLAGAPFAVEILQGESGSDGAAVLVGPELRASGLLLALAPEDLKSLVYLLTFVGPDGACRPTILDLAEAMRVSAARARSRMERLAGILWQGFPVVTGAAGSGTPEAYSPAPHVLAGPPAAGGQSLPAPADIPEAVPERAGGPYPGAEAGPPADFQSGRDPEAMPAGDLRGRLLALGVSPDQADLLLARYGAGRIARQLRWLPYRSANNPPALLVAAIEEDYEEPLSLRLALPPEIAPGGEDDVPDPAYPGP